jgi:hypothetical protein
MKYAQGKFTPKNPTKYAGKGTPTYRSSWEQVFMTFLDNNQSILSWASEPFRIPYIHPFTKKRTTYVPDFFIYYVDKKDKKHAEVIEIKPKKQSILEAKASNAMKQTVVINMAKWEAAKHFCKAQGYLFRVITEDQIFAGSKS